MNKFIVGWSDSDWAGCVETRKSTSGGIVFLGSHVIKAWSTTQDVISLSSGEAEFYAIVKMGSQSLGLQAMFKDLGLNVRIHIKTDASAAIGTSMRRGLGKARHIEVNQLWIQDKISRGEFGIEKVDGKTNLADSLTKNCESDSLQLHINGSGLAFREDRHEIAPITAVPD